MKRHADDLAVRVLGLPTSAVTANKVAFLLALKFLGNLENGDESTCSKIRLNKLARCCRPRLSR